MVRLASIIGAAALLAGCGGGSQPPIGAPRAMPQSRAGPASANASGGASDYGYTIIHQFRGGNDGANPVSGLTVVEGKLYGTTFDGGHGCYTQGCGTAYVTTTAGDEHVFYYFSGGSKSSTAAPEANLLWYDGAFYSTTAGVGDLEYGTVFRLRRDGAFNVLHKFKSGADCGNPVTPVVISHSELYGTTSGRSYCSGSVFKVSTSGHERTIYDFKGRSDGDSPSSLLPLKGIFYGTTWGGGLKGYGTIFTITRSGRKTIVYKFKPPYDGESPSGGLTLYGGKLYGTTAHGGQYGWGTVFAFDPVARKENVIHSFPGMPNDGALPVAGLIVFKGVLYGTTFLGGLHGGGSIFALNPDGANEHLLYNFPYDTDGYGPYAPLVEFNGKLYGTTGYGPGSSGEGVIFKIDPR